MVIVIQEAAKKAADARKKQRKSGDKSKEGKSAEAKPKSSKVCLFSPAQQPILCMVTLLSLLF